VDAARYRVGGPRATCEVWRCAVDWWIWLIVVVAVVVLAVLAFALIQRRRRRGGVISGRDVTGRGGRS
jgi:heme/copper-type cytochrome/quinol oxidase subunit 2